MNGQRQVFQVGAHVVIQLAFLIAAPQIGYAFLNVLFLIFAVASLRMTSFQALVAWTLTAAGVAPIFLLTRIPLGMPGGVLPTAFNAGRPINRRETQFYMQCE